MLNIHLNHPISVCDNNRVKKATGMQSQSVVYLRKCIST